MRWCLGILAALTLAVGVWGAAGRPQEDVGIPGHSSASIVADWAVPSAPYDRSVALAPGESTATHARAGPPAATTEGQGGDSRDDEHTPTEIKADINGDGSPDRVWVTTEDGPRPAERQTYIEAQVGDVHCRSGPYDATGLAAPVEVTRLPHELDDIQLLPPTPLGLADVNLDGEQDVVARFGVARSGNTTVAVVLTWDGAARQLTAIAQMETGGLLCMDATGRGAPVLISFVMVQLKVPVPRALYVWNGERFVRAQPAVPRRLAKALLPLYRLDWTQLGLDDGRTVLEGYAAAAIGAGAPLDAVNELGRALSRVDDVEYRARLAHSRILQSMAVAQVAAGDEEGAKASLGEAAALEHGGVRPSEAELAFALSVAYGDAGNREKALWWLDRAEELAGTPGAYQRKREYLETVPMLNENA